MDPTIAKAGWLHRKSSILQRWKKSWFILRTNGDLLFFEGPNSPRAEEIIVVRIKVKRIKPGCMINTDPPEGMSKGCMFSLDMVDEELRLCAESTDDMRAWEMAIEEARVLNAGNVAGPPPYNSMIRHPGYDAPVYTSGGNYPGRILYTPAPTIYTQNQTLYPGQTVVNGRGAFPPPTVIYGRNGTTTVINTPGTNVVYLDDRRRRRYGGTDMAMGMVAGAALGSMMWGPALWW